MSVEKGLGSMWELLAQLRAVLPYLTRLIPLLDKGLLHPPDLSELRGGVKQAEQASRDAASRLDQIEARIEAQRAEAAEAAVENREKIRQLTASVARLGRRLTLLTVMVLLELALLIALLVLRLH